MAIMNGTDCKRLSGFTMTELLVVIAIVAILAAIGMPAFKYVTTSNRISSEINGLLGDMQYARSEAVKQGLQVSVCSSTDGANCNGGNTWQTGWIVFLDSNPAGTTGVVDAGESVVRTQPAFNPAGDTLIPNQNFSVVTFNRNGYGSTGVAGTVTLALHDSTNTAAWTRCLAVTAVGGLTTQRSGVGACL
jgi:type IV fimbrial biogenesis protein FimT